MPKPSLPSRPTVGSRLLAIGAFVALAAVAISAGCGGAEEEAVPALGPIESDSESVVLGESLAGQTEPGQRTGQEVAPSGDAFEGELSAESGAVDAGFVVEPVDVEAYAARETPHERGLLLRAVDEDGHGIQSRFTLLEARTGLDERALRTARGQDAESVLMARGGRALGVTDEFGWLRAELPEGTFWVTATGMGLEFDGARRWGVNTSVSGFRRVRLEEATAGPVELELVPDVSALEVDLSRADGQDLERRSEHIRFLRPRLRKRVGSSFEYAGVGAWALDDTVLPKGVKRYAIRNPWPAMAASPGGWELALDGAEVLGVDPVPIDLDQLVVYTEETQVEPVQLQLPAFGGLEVTIRDVDGAPLEHGFELVARLERQPGTPRGQHEWRHVRDPRGGFHETLTFWVNDDLAVKGPEVCLSPLPLGQRFELRLRLSGSSHWHRLTVDGPRSADEVAQRDWMLEPSGAVRIVGRLSSEFEALPEDGVPRFLVARDGLPLAGGVRRPTVADDGSFVFELRGSDWDGVSGAELRVTWSGLWAQIPLPDLSASSTHELGALVLGRAPLLVAGRVKGRDGTPVGGARVTLAAVTGERAEGDPRFEELSDVAFTDSEGAFEFRGRVAAESLGVRAESASFARGDFVEIPPGTSDALLELWPGGQISGRLTAAGELPFERLELELLDLESGGVLERQRPDAAGSFEFTSLGFDLDYGVALSFHGLARGAEAVELIDRTTVRAVAPAGYGGEPTEARGFDPLELGGSLRTLRLEAVEPSGEPAARFQVRVTDAETGALLEQLEGTDGAWTLTLPDREVGLEVWSDDSARVLIPAARDAERVVLTDPLTLTVELARPEDLRFEGEPVPEYRMAVGLVPRFDDRPLQLPSSKSLVGPAGRARFQGLTFGSFDVQLQVSDPTSGRSGWVDLTLEDPPRLDLTSDNVDQVQRVDVPRAALLDAVVLALDLDVDTESGE